MAGSQCCDDNPYSKEKLKQRLTAQQYQVTQEKETESVFCDRLLPWPFTGKFYKHQEHGTYLCVVCGDDLFSSDSKFVSQCGWPSFYEVIDPSKVTLKTDLSHVSCNLLLLTLKTDMTRTEVSCSRCGAHLGHMFNDGPKPSGKRFCVNSAALDFRKAEDHSDVPNSSSLNTAASNNSEEV